MDLPESWDEDMDPNQLYVHVNLSKENAIANGETRSGYIAIRLTGALLEMLGTEERADLARSCADEQGKNLHYTAHLPVFALSNEAIASAVRARLDKARTEREAEAVRLAAIETLLTGPQSDRLVSDPSQPAGLRWTPRPEARKLVGYHDPWDRALLDEAAALNERAKIGEDGHLLDLPVDQHVAQYGADSAYAGQWYVTIDARYTRAHVRACAEVKRLNEVRAAALLEEFESVLKPALTSEQWERYQAKVLPSDERDDAMRTALFSTGGVVCFNKFVPLLEYVATLPTEVSHTEDCSQDGSVTFKVKDFTDLASLNLTADEFAAVKRVQAVYAEHPRLVSITYRLHTGECQECDETIEKIGARVRLAVGGHVYSREYAITP